MVFVTLVMEANKIGEAEVLDDGPEITAVIMDGEVDPLVVESSLLEEIAAIKRNGFKTLKADSENRARNILDLVSLKLPSLKKSNGILNGSNGIVLGSGVGELCPRTPSPEGECMEISSASNQMDDLEVLSDCETPTGVLFDPFAPGPEELVLAPKKKMTREFKIPTRRQLNFDICSDEETSESTVSDDESYILESICQSLLELVVSYQLEEICNEIFVEKDNLSDKTSDGFKTPTSLPLLTGIAETCPDTPKRPNYKSRRIDKSFSRKLEFERS